MSLEPRATDRVGKSECMSDGVLVFSWNLLTTTKICNRRLIIEVTEAEIKWIWTHPAAKIKNKSF